MPFYADLHIHSRYSRATSRDCDLEHLALWARKKGISVVGTGDFTHPAWFEEIKEKLEPAEPGLFRLRPDLDRILEKRLPPAMMVPARFMLSVEISTIYKKGDRTRKVHHVIFAPDLDSAARITGKLDRIGNIKSDGRPILGLDSRDLLEITLEAGEGCYLVPAHVWTPWFSVLGSKSGFDSIEECYGDLSSHIFALETGLSSDPPMNWRLSILDRFRLVSNSDAHSPGKLGREANVFETEMDYFSIRRALEEGDGYQGTVEFFPEEGKYHLDGHRKCGARLTPAETRKNGGLCPVCGKAVTVGVMHRVEELADRPEGKRPASAGPFRSLIPLNEVLAEIIGCGPQTKGVMKSYESLTARLGPELYILEHAPPEDIRRASSSALGEAIARMRAGKVIRQAGYDGEYGVIRLFEDGELGGSKGSGGLLFELPQEEAEPRKPEKPGKPASPKPRRKKPSRPATGSKAAPSRPDKKAGPLATLDPSQREAAMMTKGPLLIVAGPGTGKTRMLTHRIAHLVSELGVAPESCLALTFTRRAAGEMAGRLAELLPDRGGLVPVMTFHGLGYRILLEHGHELGLGRRLRVATESEQRDLLKKAGIKERRVPGLLSEISRLKRSGSLPEAGTDSSRAWETYEQGLRSRALVDFDDLVGLPLELLESRSDILESLRERWPYLSIDEYQDIDQQQYRLVKLLCPPPGNICAIGDPDQAIYGFRGGDVGFFLRFQEDYPGARVVELTRNYRSSGSIVEGSLQVVLPSSLVSDRRLEWLHDDPSLIVIHESATERAEAEFVVHSIERMIGGHTFFSLDSGRTDSAEEGDYGFSDFAVLYRTDSQAEALCEALSRSGIPFQRRTHERLCDHPGVAMLVERLGVESGGGTVAQRLESLRSSPPPDQCPPALQEESVEMLLPLARDCGRDLERFLSEISLGAVVDAWDPRADRVSLLTLHAAKGLEFRVVFIAGCEDGLIPLKWGGKEASDPGEERRLLFVGMTRARERLIISHARKRSRHGRVVDSAVSPFLKEIEERLLERLRSEKRRKAGKPGAEQLDLF